MNRSLFLTFAFFLSVAGSKAALLPGNFWPNPHFEVGENLNEPGGTPANWQRGGSDPAICQVYSLSSTNHALAVVDEGNQFGEWYSDLSLTGIASPGDQLDLRWSELFDITGSEMRVTVLFLGSGGGVLAVKHYVARGQSEGFSGEFSTSTFSERTETLDVPEGAATLRISLVSGGSPETTGTMMIDDVSVARHPAPVLLPGNIWTNSPTFEEGESLDQPSGTPLNWSRGGSEPALGQIITNAFISPSHALAVIDTSNGYVEWYSDLPLNGLTRPGDSLELQWFEMFNVSAGGEMRVTVLFLSSTGAAVDTKHFVARAQSAGWAGNVQNSPWVKRNETVQVPEGATTLRVSLVSGGSEATQGTMVIDDISIRKSAAPLPEILTGNVWPNPGFEEGQNLGDPANAEVLHWSRGGSDPALCILSSENSVSPSHALGLVDANPDGYGEWYSSFNLGAATAGGRLLNLQWFELYNIAAGEMRLTLVFFGQTNQVLGENHFVARGSSPGWKGTPADSTFTRRNEQVAVPLGATRLQAALVSGGSPAAQGTLLIDNLSLAPEATAPTTLFGNFWPNPGFEEGTDLENPSAGQPQGWSRGGADVSINRVLNNAYMSSTHALAVVDTNRTTFGEWYQALNLPATVVPGDQLEVQWWELFDISAGGEMRLSINFLTPADQALAQHHFVSKGQSSGWNEDVAHSFFTKRNERITVPAGAGKMLVTLTSGGPVETTGVLVIDDLSFAKPPPDPDLLTGNFWPNSTFEEGTQLDKPSLGLPAGGWNRGGTHIPGDQITTSRATSPIHALAVVDPHEDAYSEWYVEVPLEGKVAPGETMEVQWFELYDTTGGEMRLSFYFRGADNVVVGQQHFTGNGQSEGWTGDLATSPFIKRLEEVQVPENAVRMMVTLASGGSLAVTGTMIIDDLSMRAAGAGLMITGLSRTAEAWEISWESNVGKRYAVESSPTLSPPQFSPLPGLENVEATAALTTARDTRAGSSGTQFYRVVELP
jgi:hypothetical protein